MKSIVLIFWGVWDWLYYSFNRMQYVSKEENLFRIVRKRYKGPSLQTKTGEWIEPGDEILKIHLYNYRMAKELHNYPGNKSLAIYLKRSIQDSLIGLSAFIQQLPNSERIKGIVGTSLLNRGAERLGFATHDVDSSLYFAVKHYLYKIIYLIVHPSGLQYIREHGKKLKSKHLVMSSNELIHLYFCQENQHEKNRNLHGEKGWRRSLSSSKSN